MSNSFMASLSHHLPTLLLITLLYTTTNADSPQPSNPTCPSFDCGNGITIRYPFWHQNDQFEYCGYPGFNLACAGQAPTLRLSDDTYQVKTINYSEKTITLSYVELNEGLCPKILHDVTPTTASLFNYTVGNEMLRFFYNCTLFPPSLPSIACLEYGGTRSYVFKVGAIPEFDWPRFCEEIVTVPVMEKTVGGAMGNGFVRAMQHGFNLTWWPESVCQSCEGSGGFCGYSKTRRQNFFCLCSDGRHSANCDDKSVVSIKFEPDLVATGALISGSLIIAATVFYIIQRKKVSSNKPVFSRIPSSGK
ncbi:hypothetical protein L1049_017221 [Liquidambar formosana]|uniref:non-specific serine/threonine protein kinase n=1 Tax=Liquidambar formosana TaxID=63359 RepID=A0AAP0X404_LIQFO